jgi:mannose/fructose/N-acetylgalactosamine-specific phosphotransferase system component IID/mannose/fructose/N-acetylgalactosamine-specific phosphotransferase system component IIC
MSAAHALLLSLIISLLVLENYGYGYWMISRPIFAGPLVGAIMGDFRTGLYVGATVELMYMGILPIGGSVPPNAQIAGTISTVFAIVSGDPDVGITLAMPIGVLAQFLIMLAWNINILLEHRADKYIEQDNIKGIERTHLFGLVVFFLVFFISSYCAIYFGSDAVKALVDNLPPVINKGLSVASRLLPAVGMAMLLKMMDFKSYWCYFLGGFVLVAYLNLNTTAVSLIALVIAVAIYQAKKNTKSSADGFDDEEETPAQETIGLLDDKVLKSTFWRSFFSMTTINYERYCALGFDYAMIPAIRKLYPKKEDQIAALKRHNEFFNCHPYTGNLVLGVTLALEEERAAGKDVSEEAIRSTKAALMGPLSGIGDSVFKAVFMTLFAALAAGLALDGNPIAPWVFIIPNVALNVLSRWYFIKQGHKFGVSFVSKMTSSNALDQFVAGATIVGMMVVGSMTVSFVRVPLNVVITSGGTDLNLLDMINSIIPSILPLLVVLWFYNIMRKHTKGMYSCIILCFVIGIVGAAIHLF